MVVTHHKDTKLNGNTTYIDAQLKEKKPVVAHVIDDTINNKFSLKCKVNNDDWNIVVKKKDKQKVTRKQKEMNFSAEEKKQNLLKAKKCESDEYDSSTESKSSSEYSYKDALMGNNKPPVAQIMTTRKSTPNIDEQSECSDGTQIVSKGKKENNDYLDCKLPANITTPQATNINDTISYNIITRSNNNIKSSTLTKSEEPIDDYRRSRLRNHKALSRNYRLRDKGFKRSRSRSCSISCDTSDHDSYLSPVICLSPRHKEQRTKSPDRQSFMTYKCDENDVNIYCTFIQQLKDTEIDYNENHSTVVEMSCSNPPIQHDNNVSQNPFAIYDNDYEIVNLFNYYSSNEHLFIKDDLSHRFRYGKFNKSRIYSKNDIKKIVSLLDECDDYFLIATQYGSQNNHITDIIELYYEYKNNCKNNICKFVHHSYDEMKYLLEKNDYKSIIKGFYPNADNWDRNEVEKRYRKKYRESNFSKIFYGKEVSIQYKI